MSKLLIHCWSPISFLNTQLPHHPLNQSGAHLQHIVSVSTLFTHVFFALSLFLVVYSCLLMFSLLRSCFYWLLCQIKLETVCCIRHYPCQRWCRDAWARRTSSPETFVKNIRALTRVRPLRQYGSSRKEMNREVYRSQLKVTEVIQNNQKHTE